MKKSELIIELLTSEDQTRLDHALLDQLRKDLPTLSRAALKRLFKEQRILIHRTVASASRELRKGLHSITIKDWDPESMTDVHAKPSPQGSFLPVVYEDADLLVLDKLTGIPSVPIKPHETETAVGSALAHFPALSGIGRMGFEPGILHRLDTGTSGLLVFAKTQAEFLRLQKLWKTNQVTKIYRAVVRPKASSKQDPHPKLIKNPIAHDAKSSKRMVVISNIDQVPRSRIRGEPLPAITQILESVAIQKHLFDLTIQIKTGVMHQIRCHLASQSWPIQGDSVYGGTPSRRLWLHAWKLRFTLSSGKPLELEAKLPAGWPEKKQ